MLGWTLRIPVSLVRLGLRPKETQEPDANRPPIPDPRTLASVEPGGVQVTIGGTLNTPMKLHGMSTAHMTGSIDPELKRDLDHRLLEGIEVEDFMEICCVDRITGVKN